MEYHIVSKCTLSHIEYASFTNPRWNLRFFPLSTGKDVQSPVHPVLSFSLIPAIIAGGAAACH